MENELETGEVLRVRKVRKHTGGQCFRAWLLQSSEASEKLTARQVGPWPPPTWRRESMRLGAHSTFP